MDQIIVEDLQVYAYHGVHRQENEKGQNFFVNVTLDTDTREAACSDDLDLSTNYGEICRFVHRFLTEHTYKLIETAAERCAEALLLWFPRVRQVTLELMKPEAPIKLSFGSVSVKIVRGWRSACIACGSNMGDRKAHLEVAAQGVMGGQEVQDYAGVGLDGDHPLRRSGAGEFFKRRVFFGDALHPGGASGGIAEN